MRLCDLLPIVSVFRHENIRGTVEWSSRNGCLWFSGLGKPPPDGAQRRNVLCDMWNSRKEEGEKRIVSMIIENRAKCEVKTVLCGILNFHQFLRFVEIQQNVDSSSKVIDL